MCMCTSLADILMLHVNTGGVKVDEWPEAPRGADEEIARVTNLLKTYLMQHF